MIYDMSAEERLGMFIDCRRGVGINLLYTGTLAAKDDMGKTRACRMFFQVSDKVAGIAVPLMQYESELDMEIEAETAARQARRDAARAPVRNEPVQ